MRSQHPTENPHPDEELTAAMLKPTDQQWERMLAIVRKEAHLARIEQAVVTAGTG